MLQKMLLLCTTPKYTIMNGHPFCSIFNEQHRQSLTYDDIILLPNFIDTNLEDIDLSSRLTTNITLKTPFVSSPMDTVTESDMAIQLALQGGLGFIHCNNTIDEQVEHVKRVKRYSNGIVTDPVTIKPNNTVQDVIELQTHNDFSSFPVVDDNNILLGIVARRDIEFIEKHDRDTIIVKDILNTRLVTLPVGTTLDEAKTKMQLTKVKRIPIVDTDNHLKGLFCRKDILNFTRYPLATRNPNTKQLLVGAAVSTHQRDRSRIDRLITEAHVDVIVVDSAQGASTYQIETIKYIKQTYPGVVDVIGGNVVTPAQAQHLIDAKVDGLRVGMGIGNHPHPCRIWYFLTILF